MHCTRVETRGVQTRIRGTFYFFGDKTKLAGARRNRGRGWEYLGMMRVTLHITFITVWHYCTFLRLDSKKYITIKNANHGSGSSRCMGRILTATADAIESKCDSHVIWCGAVTRILQPSRRHYVCFLV